MRIVHLTASTFFGGPERQMLGLAESLSPSFSTTFLSFSEHHRCRAFLNVVRQAGFDAAELHYDSPHARLAICEIAAFLRGNFADVLVTHGYKSNLLGRPAARQARIPIVSVSRGWTGENLKVWCYEALDRFHLRFMDRVVCVSACQARRVLRTGIDAKKVHVIRNAARLRAFDTIDPDGQTRLRSLAGGDGPIVLAAGRLSPEKGFSVLVDAAKRVHSRVPNARFVLFGQGAERPRLESQIARLGLAGVFRLAGYCNDLDALIPWADVIALPSFTEGLPNVALEAGAAGVPVVATSVGGTPEVVLDGETGYLVSAGDDAALSDRIVDLIANREKARLFGAAAVRRMAGEFSFEAQARAYEALFAELAGKAIRGRSHREAACS
jgi:glycosyltransferase involved in cell wall biosynthesis